MIFSGTDIQKILDEVVMQSRAFTDGSVANYIPELARVDPERVSAAIMRLDGQTYFSGDADHVFTLQSVAKTVVLIGLMEEYGARTLFSWINAEPSGSAFSSVAELDRLGTTPSNPMINAGAIALCSRIPGDADQRAKWLDKWVENCFGKTLYVNESVYQSERATGNRNRSIAYLLKSNDVLPLEVEDALNTYYRLCSYEADVTTMAYLPMLLANGGRNAQGRQIFSQSTCSKVVAIMATCGLYDESGMYLVHTGLPAKSGISGAIIAVSTGRAGIAVCSPRVNAKGGSVRGHYILQQLSDKLSWHFASLDE
jgi:glutaminase